MPQQWLCDLMMLAAGLAWMCMLRRYQPTKIATFVFLTLVFALLMGALWLHEPITSSLIAVLAPLAVSIVLVDHKPRGSPCNL